MQGYEYEEMCAYFLSTKGFNNIQLTPATGDHGVDIICSKNDLKYGVQCKYYNSPVGNKAVQEAFSGSHYYDCDIAAVITNSIYTKSAIKEAETLGVLLWQYDGNSSNETVNVKNKLSFFSKVMLFFYFFVLFVHILFIKELFEAKTIPTIISNCLSFVATILAIMRIIRPFKFRQLSIISACCWAYILIFSSSDIGTFLIGLAFTILPVKYCIEDYHNELMDFIIKMMTEKNRYEKTGTN